MDPILLSPGLCSWRASPQGKLDEAIKLWSESEEILADFLGDDHAHVKNIQEVLAYAKQKRGKKKRKKSDPPA